MDITRGKLGVIFARYVQIEAVLCDNKQSGNWYWEHCLPGNINPQKFCKDLQRLDAPGKICPRVGWRVFDLPDGRVVPRDTFQKHVPQKK